MKSTNRLSHAVGLICALLLMASASLASAQYLSRLAIYRVNANGTADTTFNSTGSRTVDFAWANDEKILALAPSPGGKIVAAGVANSKFLIARFNSDGSFDTTFNGTGWISHTFVATESASANAVAIDSSGRIVVAGVSGVWMAITRFNSNGSHDTTFGNKRVGWSGYYSEANDLAVQTDGKIVLAGGSSAAGVSQASLIRLNSNGTYDTTFGSGGGTFVNICPSATAVGLVLDASARIFIAGNCVGSTSGSVGVARLTTAGALDTGFSGDGKATYRRTPTSVDAVWTIGKDASNRIILGGYTISPNIALQTTRILNNGNLDTSYGGDGFYRWDTGDDYQSVFKVRAHGSQIYAAVERSDESRMSVIRHNSDGSGDTTFSGDGLFNWNFGTDVQWPRDVIIDSNGKIVVGGAIGSHIPL